MAETQAIIVSMNRLRAMRLAESQGYPHASVLTVEDELYNAGNGKEAKVPKRSARIIFDDYGLTGEDGKKYEKLLQELEVKLSE